ncbi:glycoside hydrolase family 88 protein [Paraflavisolibacter sp. H34]|uniref:glycoside hydrolase family 88 protein n=1 Tax=Huijunlia imazamoxiresistens TaxID=3127457 RepID=UPI003018B852
MKKFAQTLLFTVVAGAGALAQSGSLNATSQAAAKGESYAAQMAKTVMTIWSDSLTQQSPGRTARWSYDQGVILEGIEGLWRNTADKKYFNYLQKSMDFFVQEDGTIRTYHAGEYNIDHVLCGRNLLTLYKVTGKEKYRKAVNLLRDQLRTHPRTKEGGFWHKEVYPWQMWLDGLYMGQPFYAEYAATFREDTAFNDIAKQFILMERHSRDNKTGLLYHGYDESRQQQWADKVTGRSPNFWARAMGWYGNALVDAIEWFPKDHPKRDSLIGILNRFATAVASVQDKETGLWWDVLDMPKREKNYFEASASSMFVYALAKGVRLGYLPQKFVPVAQKGYKGILNQFVKTENGQVNLHGTVSVSGLGGNPYRDGSFEYYMREKVIVNDPKGVGAFIQAANEIDLLPTLPVGKGKTVLLDNYFNREYNKGANGEPQLFHYVWDEMDNNGLNLFGYVFQKHGVDTQTLATAPTAESLKKVQMYLIVDPDTQKETAKPNYIESKDIDVIYNWVKDGGVLLLFGNDSGNVEFTHFNQLAGRFGIQFNYDSRNRVQGSQYEVGTFEIPAKHEIFKNPKKIYIKEYASQTVKAPARAVFSDKGVVVMSVAKVGKGTVFAVGDPWFYNEYIDGRKLPGELENYKAAEDLVQWAIKQAKK